MNIKLNPCPLCGSTKTFISSEEHFNKTDGICCLRIECDNEKCMGVGVNNFDNTLTEGVENTYKSRIKHLAGIWNGLRYACNNKEDDTSGKQQ